MQQSLACGSIDDFLNYLPEEELIIVEKLRKIIFNCLPAIKEKLSYNIQAFLFETAIIDKALAKKKTK